jgi:LPPG:FO 2-phospho-L-lactate transferase
VIVLLSGGVGGAKLAEGLAGIVPPSELAVIGNTGDDLEWLGLRVCPDLDIVMYTLAGSVNRSTGWGIAGDTFGANAMLGAYGQETWFQVGDRDLATSLLRTSWLNAGATLTEATRRLCESLGVETRLIPMSDAPVRTIIDTPDGPRPFQEYFVARKALDRVVGVRFWGIEAAAAAPQALDALERADAIVIAPSNPIVSVGPILATPGIRDAIERSAARKVAVSPLIAGRAVKGPAVEIMQGLGLRPDALGVAERYAGLLDVFIVDDADAGLCGEIERLGMQARAIATLMLDSASKRRLATAVLEAARAR